MSPAGLGPDASLSSSIMTSRPLPPARASRTPSWVVEGLDIAQRRAGLLRLVVAVVCVAGLLTAWLAPGIVPPTWTVGAAVGVAALLLGLAAAVAADAADLTLRGPRHVLAAGGELVAVVPVDPDPAAAAALADAVLDAREPGAKLILGLAAAGRDARHTAALTDVLAVAVARLGVSVLRLDLAGGRTARPGLYEVLRRGHRLADAVDFEPGDLALARLGAGQDLGGALDALPELPGRLPRDLDVLLVALPTAASRPSVQAAAALDHVLVVAERDLTSRVDLIAGLDALEAVGIAAQVVLLDDVTAARAVPPEAGAPVPEPAVPEPVAPDPEPEPEPHPEPVRASAPDPEPDPEPHPEPVRASAPDPEPEPEPHPEPEPEPVRASAPDPDATTRLQPVHPADPWGPDDDPLRTTAQLAVLLDDLEARAKDEAGRTTSGPGSRRS